MSDKNAVAAITDKIQAEAQDWADEQTAAANAEADALLADYEAQAKAACEQAVLQARSKAEAVLRRAESQGDMDRRKMLLATRQECIAEAFGAALERMCALPDEERVMLMVKNAVRYQTGDAEYIFNAADRETIGPMVVETVNSIFKKEKLRETFSGSFLENVRKLFTSAATHAATLSARTGNFKGGFILSQGDVELNCTFEVLVGQMRETLEGETAALLFGQGGGG